RRADGRLCGARRGRSRIFVVQLPSGESHHGRHWRARDRRSHRSHRDLLQTRIAPRRGRRRFCDRSGFRYSPGAQFPADRQTHLRDVADPSSLRVERLEGKHRHRALLDSLRNLRAPRPGHFETAMKYQGKNVAVLGAGLSGTAAALLLRSEAAEVTVLDSAEEKTLLKSTIENLRTRGIAVRCGRDAETDSSNYDFVVLSPG